LCRVSPNKLPPREHLDAAPTKAAAGARSFDPHAHTVLGYIFD